MRMESFIILIIQITCLTIKLLNGTCGVSITLSSLPTKWNITPADCPGIFDFNNDTIHKKIATFMQNQNKPAWLPIRRVSFDDGWHWNNVQEEFYAVNTPMTSDKQISTKQWKAEGMDCAVLRALDNFLDDVYCDKEYGYFICQGLDYCDKKSGSNCLNITGVTYNIYKQSGTWYQASNRCFSRHGQTLAAFGNDHKQTALDAIAQHFKKWANIWIGLTKSVFRMKNSNQQVRIYKWAPHEPTKSENKSCVVAFPADGNLVWRSENCSATYKHICFAKHQNVATTKMTAGPALNRSDNKRFTNSTNSSSGPNLILVIVLAVTATGLVILSLLLAWICRTNDIKLKRPEMKCFAKKSIEEGDVNEMQSMISGTASPPEEQTEPVVESQNATKNITYCDQSGNTGASKESDVTNDENQVSDVPTVADETEQGQLAEARAEVNHPEGSDSSQSKQAVAPVVVNTDDPAQKVTFFPELKSFTMDSSLESREALFILHNHIDEGPQIHIKSTTERNEIFEKIGILPITFTIRDDRITIHWTQSNKTQKVVFTNDKYAEAVLERIRKIKDEGTLFKSQVKVKIPVGDEKNGKTVDAELIVFKYSAVNFVVTIGGFYEKPITLLEISWKDQSEIAEWKESDSNKSFSVDFMIAEHAAAFKIAIAKVMNQTTDIKSGSLEHTGQ